YRLKLPDMSDIKSNFTDNEWNYIAIAPISAACAVVFADNVLTNPLSAIKEMKGLKDVLKKVSAEYPSNKLIQDTFKILDDAKTLEDLNRTADRMNEDVEKNAPELKKYFENDSIEKIFEETFEKEGFLKTFSAVFAIIPMLAGKIAESKKMEGTEEFKQAIYKVAYETANAAKEGWFGFGDPISKDEARFLDKLKKFLEIA
ncbi:MAG TPA: hypothetical protein PL169_14555, partial [Leptospiraceae bacterium]|nr:hypothetical protein [Leptospiraceae bacterium]